MPIPRPRIGGSYYPNFKSASRVQQFCKRRGGCDKPLPPPPPKPSPPVPVNLEFSFKTNYDIHLDPTVNSNNSVTFSGKINKSNTSVTHIEIIPLEPEYTVSYTYNSKTGSISITLENYPNDVNISLSIVGKQYFAGTTHNVNYTYRYLAN